MQLLEDYLIHLEETDPLHMAQIGVASMISGQDRFEDAQTMLFDFCNEQYEDDPVRLERCKSLKYTSSGITYGEAIEPLSYAAGGAVGILATTLINWAHKKYMEIYGKANEACGRLKGSEGRMCRQNYKVEATKAEIQALKYARSKCRRSKDPKLCVQKLNEKIKKLMDKYPDIEYTMKAIKKHKQA